MGDLLARLQPWLAVVRDGSPLGLGVAALAGVALGLSPASYPLVPVVVGYAGGRGAARGRAAALSLAFVLGLTTVYVALGALWGSLGGLLLLNLLADSLAVWYGLAAAALWLLAGRLLGLVRFGVPLLAPPDPARGPRGLLGAYLLGLPFGPAACASCAPVLLTVLTAVTATGQPLLGALAMLALGLGQGVVLVAAGTSGGTLANLRALARWRPTIERLLGLVLLLVALYFILLAVQYAPA